MARVGPPPVGGADRGGRRALPCARPALRTSAGFFERCGGASGSIHAVAVANDTGEQHIDQSPTAPQAATACDDVGHACRLLIAGRRLA